MTDEPLGSAVAQSQDDMLSKYKRLLSMARSSLEANQLTLQQKDQQISQLVAALEEERLKRSISRSVKDEDGAQVYPRRIVSRVDVEGMIWLLLEYEGAEDDWKSFTDELAVHDFIKRVPGIPLVCPQKCLSMDESSKLVEESKRKVEKVMEEFRRYKVKMEITIKQKEAEAKPLIASTPNFGSSFGSQLNGSALPHALEKALSLGASGDSGVRGDEIQRMKQLMQEQDAKWRNAYERLSKDLDTLKTKGAEAVVAAQWRNRYDSCAKERDELQRKLQLYSQLSSELATSDKSLEELYLELSEAYKGLRRRMLAFIQQYVVKPSEDFSLEDIVRELTSILEAYRIGHQEMDDLHVYHRLENENKGAGTGMAESKVQYVRQMMYQYFLCTEEEVKQHIEAALMAIFRFTDEEKTIIEERRKDVEGLGIDNTLSSFTSFLGSFTSS